MAVDALVNCVVSLRFGGGGGIFRPPLPKLPVEYCCVWLEIITGSASEIRTVLPVWYIDVCD